jgi:hypothetical protein
VFQRFSGVAAVLLAALALAISVNRRLCRQCRRFPFFLPLTAAGRDRRSAALILWIVAASRAGGVADDLAAVDSWLIRERRPSSRSSLCSPERPASPQHVQRIRLGRVGLSERGGDAVARRAVAG